MSFIFRPTRAKAAAATAGALIVLLAFVGPSAQAAENTAEDVGDVDAVVATAEASRADAVRRLALNDPLYEGDRLETGPGARLHATLADGGVLMLGADAVVEIDRMVLSRGEAAGELSVLRGAFRMVSGEVNKSLGGALTLRTPVATIGIRGTDFWGLQQEDSLLMALLDDGELSITLPTGTIVLTEPMTLMRFERGQDLPTLETLTPEALGQAAQTVALPE